MTRPNPSDLDADEAARWTRRAGDVIIVRDDWGIAHVHGRTDADAVFGMMYAQAEDDFRRIEANYLVALGRSAEASTDPWAVWSDLRARLFVDPEALRARYAAAPPWLRCLMQAWADGLNYYLATHPETNPRVLRRFEPWMALSFTEGANGADIARIDLAELAAFYGQGEPSPAAMAPHRAPGGAGGSNGIALAPGMTQDGHPLLLINPHTTFFLRSEMQVGSGEGLNVYGAVTWGQFFVYQGFNERAGWMHTTSTADCVDEFAERIVGGDGEFHYVFGSERRPVQADRVELDARGRDGALLRRVFTVFRTHHGPIVRAVDGQWIAARLMDRPVEALEQAFLRTKAQNLGEFLEVSRRAANSTNNTVFADAAGNIALLTPQFLPLRNDRFDYTRPVDGADPATDWQGVTPQDQRPDIVNPPKGWVFNVNDGPWWGAGRNSPERSDFPRYMDSVGANTRTAHALAILETWRGFTLERLRDAAYDPELPVFRTLLPGLVAAHSMLASDDPQRLKLAPVIDVLAVWDLRASVDSVATTIAVEWGETLRARFASGLRPGRLSVVAAIGRASSEEQLQALADVVERLETDFGTWRVPWGDINRFQRLDATDPPRFDDAEPSSPVGSASSQWGALTAYTSARHEGTRRLYGVSGNAFVAVVEFGPRLRALAVNPGGSSGDPSSPHFADQSERFAEGRLRPVYFYPDDLAAHVTRAYQPGHEGAQT